MQRIILDTREPHEYQTSHVDGALSTPASAYFDGTMPPVLESYPKDGEIIVYCRSGMRSNTVGKILEDHGFTNIVKGINEQHVAKLIAGANA